MAEFKLRVKIIKPWNNIIFDSGLITKGFFVNTFHVICKYPVCTKFKCDRSNSQTDVDQADDNILNHGCARDWIFGFDAFHPVGQLTTWFKIFEHASHAWDKIASF